MSSELARVNPSTVSLIPTSEEWGTIHQMAKALIPTGFLPQSIKTPEQAVAIILKGKELQVPPMYALSNIVVVQGKPTCSAEMMLALVQRDHGIGAMWVEETDNAHCTVGYRSGNGKKFYTWTMQDAENAGLTKNPTWRSYPAAMCRARAISAVARMAFPGSIAGMYTPGELGDPVTVDDDGVVVSVGVIDDAPQSPVSEKGTARTPDTASAPSAPHRPAQRLTGANPDEERERLNAALHAQRPHALLHDLAVTLWKKPSFSDMTLKDLRSLQMFLAGQGAQEKQAEFDEWIDAWEATHVDDDAMTDVEVVESGPLDLFPDEDELPNPDRWTR